jgi:phospholipid/cholesterol/gamma-HCH transport system substrate-binding protein
MLSVRSRNLIVGLTMLLALAVLMYGIILLGKFPTLSSGYNVTLISTDANGVTPGSNVLLNGMGIGQVKSVWLKADSTGKLMANVLIQIDMHYDLPKSTHVELSRPQTVGNPFVALHVDDVSGPKIPKDGSAVLQAAVGDSSLIPKKVWDDVTSLTQRLSTVADDLHIMLVYAPPEDVEKADPRDPKRVRPNVTTVVVRLDRLVKNMQELLGDPQLQGKVRDAIQNIADASAQLKQTLQKIDAAAGNASGTVAAIGSAATQATATLQTTQLEVGRVSQKLVETLTDLQKLTRQINEGNGTAGKLLNDPRLYEGLVDLSKSMKSTVEDLDFLLNKWKDEGVNLRLK